MNEAKSLVFVFVPADKAANIIVVVWCKYYVQILKEEIVNSKTFQNMPISYIDIINKYGLFTQPLSATLRLENILMYKLHKQPFKFHQPWANVPPQKNMFTCENFAQSNLL